MSILVKAKLISLLLFGIPALLWVAYLLITSGKKEQKPVAAQAAEQPVQGAPVVSFTTEGRSGQFTYQSQEGRFTSYWEFGGGDYLAILYLPSEEQWEAKTGLPLAKRAEVLDLIGRETVRQQTTNGKGRFELDGNYILIRN